MKALKTLIAIALSAGGLGTAVTLGAVSNNERDIQPALAADTYSVYINTAEWGDNVSGVKYYSWAWKSGQNGSWYDFTKVEDHLYSMSVPASVDSFIFFRAGSNMSHGWTENTNYWNKTGDLTASGDYFTFSGYSTGTWSYYKDSYIYYISDSNSATNNKIYSWDVKQFGSWSGTNITSVSGVTEVQGVLHFDGNNVKIYKIPFSSRDTGLLFNYNGSSQSANKTFGEGYAYTWTENDPQAAGLALELLLDIENARNSASWSGHNYSVCGISSTDAKAFVNRYNALNSTAKGYFNNSTTYTYKDSSASAQDNISYRLIIERLAIISGVSVSSSQLMKNLSNKQNYTLVITIVGVITLASLVGTLFLLRKKRKEQ